MFALSITEDAQQDLDAIWEAGESEEAARIEVFFEQADSDQKILESFLEHKFDNGVYSVSRWLQFWNKGLDLWRARILDMPAVSRKYRVIYAYDLNYRRFYILGVLNRDFDYEPNDPRTQRILRAYENLIG